ncbi:hypothetical protein QQF64_012310 [Cirrhinus molitorella]|uniref:Uncharacterized protein n=1 Tax=Cirrhinus molitorella TaxID=172907 RepID=A0ABR3LWR7_9TELE
MKDTDKVRFLNAPISQTGLFGDAVENFAQQFSAAQKQSEAIKHILPRRAAAASTRRPQRLSLLVAEGGPLLPPPLHRSRRSSLHNGAVEPVAGQPPSPSRPPPGPVGSERASDPETGDPEMEETALREMVDAPLPPPEEGRNSLITPCFKAKLSSPGGLITAGKDTHGTGKKPTEETPSSDKLNFLKSYSRM